VGYNGIVKFSYPNKMDNQLTVSQKSVLINPEYTGQETSQGRKLPIINILQSDKQYKAFGDDYAKVSMSMYGKLFVRTERNSLDDLVDSVTGSFMKAQMGHEIYEDDGSGSSVLIASVSGLMRKDDKQNYELSNPGRKVVNTVKVILCLHSAKKASEMLLKGENPFAVLVFKKASFNSWIEAQKAMNIKSLGSSIYQNKMSSELASTVFSFVVSSEKVEIKERKTEYYIPKVDVSLNDPAEAEALYKLALELKSISLFGKEIVDEIKAESKDVLNLDVREAEATKIDIDDFNPKEYISSLR